MMEYNDLLEGTKKVYNCCNQKAVSIIADRANTKRLPLLESEIKESEANECRTDETGNDE